jgi:hypothetical protein
MLNAHAMARFFACCCHTEMEPHAKCMVMGSEAKSDCAGEGHEQRTALLCDRKAG